MRTLGALVGAVEPVADDVRALALARGITESDDAARRLLGEAQQQAEALVAQPGFREVTQRLARELLARGSLDGEVIAEMADRLAHAWLVRD